MGPVGQATCLRKTNDDGREKHAELTPTKLQRQVGVGSCCRSHYRSLLTGTFTSCPVSKKDWLGVFS